MLTTKKQLREQEWSWGDTVGRTEPTPIRSRSSPAPVGTGRLAASTHLPTPTGWTTVGRLRSGDQLLDRRGRPCTVTRLSTFEQDADLYRVAFSDGQHVLADAEHRWVVSEASEREQVLSTRELLDRGLRTSRGRHAYAIRLASSLDLSARDLPLDPYALGRRPWARIPGGYLRGSTEQRLALLQGLMDSRGCLDSVGAYELRLLSVELASDAAELIRSLGVAATLSTDIRSASTCHVTFATDLPVFRRSRALDEVVDQVPPQEAAELIHVTAIEPVTPGSTGHEAVRAVGVDSSDSTYLVAGMVPSCAAVFAGAVTDSAAPVLAVA